MLQSLFSVFLLCFSFLVFIFLRHLSLFENNAAFPRLGCKEESAALDKKKGVSVKDTDSAFCAYLGPLSGFRTQVTLPTPSPPPGAHCSCLPEVSHGRQEREELSQQNAAGRGMTGSVTWSSFSHSCVSWAFAVNPKHWNFMSFLFLTDSLLFFVSWLLVPTLLSWGCVSETQSCPGPTEMLCFQSGHLSAIWNASPWGWILSLKIQGCRAAPLVECEPGEERKLRWSLSSCPLEGHLIDGLYLCSSCGICGVFLYLIVSHWWRQDH